jgi:hypothetical protein
MVLGGRGGSITGLLQGGSGRSHRWYASRRTQP